MKLKHVALATLAAFGLAQGAQAQVSGDAVKIGFITDMSGLYADLDGPGGAEAIKMAIADAGGMVAGKKIEFISADNQNKADVAASKAREWFDTQGVDMIIGGTNSAAMLAISKVAAEKKKLFIVVGSGSTRITNEDCAPASTLHYAYDTRALGYGTGSAVTKAGGKSWFFLTADYAFGQSLEKDTGDVVKANGGTVVGAVRHPLSASDFSSYLLQAQSSKAQILGLANAGGDTINAIKAANEFGVTSTMKLAGLLMFITDIHALGLKATQGMYLTDSWYWNQSPESRTWSRRYFEKMKKMPSSVQAADYSVASNYLKAVAATKTDDTDAVLKQLKSAPINDFYVKNAVVRDDGKVVHDMFLYQVKTPAESKEPWDYLTQVAVVPGDKAYNSKAESRCAAWK